MYPLVFILFERWRDRKPQREILSASSPHLPPNADCRCAGSSRKQKTKILPVNWVAETYYYLGHLFLPLSMQIHLKLDQKGRNWSGTIPSDRGFSSSGSSLITVPLIHHSSCTFWSIFMFSFFFIQYIYQIVFLLSTCLFPSSSYRGRKSEIFHFCCLFAQRLQWTGLCQARTRSCSQDLQMDSKKPNIWTIMCSLSQASITLELDCKCRIWDLNQYQMGCWNCKWWFYLPCHNTRPSDKILNKL